MKKIFKIALLLLGLLAFLFLFDIGCIFRHITGFPCPGCGTTRALIAFSQGKVVDAFYYHPLFWLSALLLAVGMLRGGILFKAPMLSKWSMIILLVIYITVYIMRMILLFPDKPPMDYNYHSLGYQIYLHLFGN